MNLYQEITTDTELQPKNNWYKIVPPIKTNKISKPLFCELSETTINYDKVDNKSVSRNYNRYRTTTR